MTIQIGYLKPKSMSIWLIAAIGMLLGVGGFFIWASHIEPVYSIINPYLSPLANVAASIPSTLQKLWAGLVQNPMTAVPYVTAGVSAVGVAYGLISKVRSIRAENAKQEAEAQLTQQGADFQNQFTQKNQDLINAQNKITDLQQKLTEATNGDSPKILEELSDTKAENTFLRGQVQSLQEALDRQKLKTYKETVVK